MFTLVDLREIVLRTRKRFPFERERTRMQTKGVGAMRWWRETTPVDHRRGTTRWIERTGSRFAVYRETLHGIRSRDTLVGEDR